MNGEEALKRLLDGNKKYMSGTLAAKDVKKAREATKNGQHPFVTILCCSDSRVPPELVFDANVGEIFIVRNAGNCVDTLTLGSIEYGVEHLHTPLLVVLGHEKCGAVTAACQGNVCPPNIAAIMEKIKPAVDKKGNEGVEQTIVCNLDVVSNEIRRRSEIVRHLEKEKKLKVVEMKYYFEDGRVEIIA
ncbi:Carbonic anhydrase [Candidatus Bilamarchaeum dharawalense]|uniref:carbonic anhydrase n=1 Tax=Candidatus Bilamarchaeum dharawalense TaxID=2885759 RepID=A0A5E4LKQ6_9ARCH|nr:Carbonic anhydrase [Candidatus Bilamarchaeum dharawalense]